MFASQSVLVAHRLFHGTRRKILAGILGIILVVTLIGAVLTQVIRDNIETYARANATSAALAQAQTLAREEVNPPKPSLFSRPTLLQEYVVDHVHVVERQKIVVVDKHKRILADVVQANIGIIYDRGLGNEVGKTLADGATRTFVETSADYPQGIHQIVVPIMSDHDASIVGALVLEYSSTYRNALSIAADVTNAFLLFNLIGGVLSSLLIYYVVHSISDPARKLNQAALRIAQGDLTTEIAVPRGSELEALAKTLDEMRWNLAASFEKLAVEIGERKRVEETLRASEAKYQQLIESIPEIIYAGDFGTDAMTSSLTFVSAQVEQILGYTAD